MIRLNYYTRAQAVADGAAVGLAADGDADARSTGYYYHHQYD